MIRGKLASSSYLATSGGDSCITIWKTGDESPFFIIRQAFHSGVNDLSWGMEGNLLFGCSNDGEIMVCHFRPGILGEFLNDWEKEQILLSNYGEAVVKEF